MELQKSPNHSLLATEVSIDADPRVSIVIPYYNPHHVQTPFLMESVLSAKRQAYANVEIIVVDDGSVTPAEPALQQFSDIVVLRTENRGVSAARNLGFQKSTGDFLIFLDHDDRLMPGTIEAHLREHRDHPDAGLSFGATRIIDRAGKEVRQAHICRPRKNYFLMLLEGNPIGSPGAAMIRRTAFMAAGGFNEAVSMGEDYDLYLRIARRARVVRHSFCVLEYREHSANTSLDQERMLASTMVVLNQIEPLLSNAERKRLPHARRRWRHLFRRKPTLGYRLKSLYYSCRAMGGVPFVSYFGNRG